MTFTRWCPNSCGKCVTYTHIALVRGTWKKYKCDRCGKIFTKQELDEALET